MSWPSSADASRTLRGEPSDRDPRRGRPGYDRQGVLDVAVRAFNEYGYDATSMGTLADRLGLSKSAIYHHFTSKEQLLDAALDEALGGLEGVLAGAGGASPDRPRRACSTCSTAPCMCWSSGCPT